MEKPVYKIADSEVDLQKAFCVRSIVFVFEQNCPYVEEFDGLDGTATHFLGLYGEEPFAAARFRILEEGVVKLERLAVRKKFRGGGTGSEFLRYILEYIGTLGHKKIVIHAQAHLSHFYEGFGFVRKGGMFNEANIPHYYMEKEMK